MSVAADGRDSATGPVWAAVPMTTVACRTLRGASGGATGGVIAVVAAAFLVIVGPPRAGAFPEGAPWESAEDEGCLQCHFDAPPVEGSPALTIEGLPERVSAGASYALTVRLRAEGMKRAGFLLSAWREGQQAAGRFAPADARTAAQSAQARSTETGAALSAPAAAEWRLEWTAPPVVAEPIRFELWANAANDDESPFGDQTHRRTWRIPPGGASD